MSYKIFPVKEKVYFNEGEVFGVRSGSSLEDAVTNLQYAVKSGFTSKIPEEAIICVYQIGKERYEAVATLKEYVPLLFRTAKENPAPEVIIKDRRGKK